MTDVEKITMACMSAEELRAELTALRAERDQLKAEVEDTRDHRAMVAFFEGPGWESKRSYKTARQILNERDAALAQVKALREALTPSAATKAAFIGEFKFAGGEDGYDVTVPWTTVKEIMAAILARAALTQTAPKGDDNE